MAVITIERTVDLDRLGKTEQAQGTLYQQENLAHKFVIHGRRNGANEDFSGTVSGSFIKPDGGTLPLTGGLENGAAYVTLIGDCYEITGRFTLTIFVTANGVTTAVYSITGNVKQTETGTIVDPGTIISNVATLISDMETATEALQEAAISVSVDQNNRIVITSAAE